MPQWNSAWPVAVTSSSMDALIQQSGASEKPVSGDGSPLNTQISDIVLNVTGSLATDMAYKNALDGIGNQLYIAGGESLARR